MDSASTHAHQAQSSAYPRVVPVGESAFTVEFGDTVDLSLNQHVHDLDAALREHPIPGILETVPTYRALLVLYKPTFNNTARIRKALLARARTVAPAERAAGHEDEAGRLVEIPVHYGGEAGPDLADVAAHCDLTPEEVIRRHTTPTYQVAMLGFAPGFAYLVGLPPSLATPRLATPRRRVAPGSVGIAGEQTGIYALATPGGWRIIGRTTLTLFDPDREEPFSLKAGDRVRFVVAKA
jgi:inhibitor of KinA